VGQTPTATRGLGRREEPDSLRRVRERGECDDVALETAVPLSARFILRFPSIGGVARFEHATVGNRLVDVRVGAARLDETESGVDYLNTPASRDRLRLVTDLVVRFVVRQFARDLVTKLPCQFRPQAPRCRNQAPRTSEPSPNGSPQHCHSQASIQTLIVSGR
jgi:hypothetical protein